ncbi:methylated-DNA--[protein]-cysteine S-methyltransferase [Williamwhitmania taraxaci]|uniref:methylated-DNA--[protein]-cysteine S-methyltransferase n=1 Tax=Williamwhitmania taraxaci TaxID=1640674 RepID=A0A1G6JZW8_9BACT|nr:methylated-DNA--[protein]-cysteine S-methyltransferase [Williamwhitmania taraxaci]SDC24332.1 methylated-DNA-[protein]-cysteine S-methyltransferase [Williamwhitmania taraxaci]
MNTISIDYFSTPFGELVLGSFGNALCLCDWRYRKMRSEIDFRIASGLAATYQQGETPIIAQTKAQLADYFAGIAKTFDLPMLLVGSDFQKSVWHALLEVPYGTTETYRGLSKSMNNPKAIRAVASANGANALAIIIPCHRIIGSTGELVGYTGGLPAKRKLLDLESAGTTHQLSLFD